MRPDRRWESTRNRISKKVENQERNCYWKTENLGLYCQSTGKTSTCYAIRDRKDTSWKVDLSKEISKQNKAFV